MILDDFREAYYWLRMNTAADSRIMSWWDYGYQTTDMANRTVLVDNNTWNNTHIATVGRAMSSTEEDGYRIARSLDADYLLVVFGGMAGYSVRARAQRGVCCGCRSPPSPPSFSLTTSTSSCGWCASAAACTRT